MLSGCGFRFLKVAFGVRYRAPQVSSLCDVLTPIIPHKVPNIL